MSFYGSDYEASQFIYLLMLYIDIKNLIKNLILKGKKYEKKNIDYSSTNLQC